MVQLVDIEVVLVEMAVLLAAVVDIQDSAGGNGGFFSPLAAGG